MAYTKIIPIRSRLDHCLAYIQNEDKTNIAANSDPPQCLQSAFSCRLDSAYADMKKVKQRWHKDSSNHVLGYHIILSFAPQEVTPEQAHAIGCEFVTQYLKQEYQSVVSTHIDKSHLHCHIVFNSVNLLTGHMYTNTFSDYFSGIRKTSDAICLAHGLSVINPKGHSQSRAAYQAAQRGAPTIRTLMCRDLDEFLKHARNFPDFLCKLEQRGYDVKRNGKYISLRRPGASRFIRLHSLGTDYTPESLSWRIMQLHRIPVQFRELPKHIPRHLSYHGKLSQRKRYTGFLALYFYYVCLLCGAKLDQKPRAVSRVLMDDIIRLDKIISQMKVIYKYNIQTVANISTCCTTLEMQIKQLSEERKQIKKGSPTYAQMKIQLSSLRKDLKIARQIPDTLPQIQKNIKQIGLLFQTPTAAKRQKRIQRERG